MCDGGPNVCEDLCNLPSFTSVTENMLFTKSLFAMRFHLVLCVETSYRTMNYNFVGMAVRMK